MASPLIKSTARASTGSRMKGLGGSVCRFRGRRLKLLAVLDFRADQIRFAGVIHGRQQAVGGGRRIGVVPAPTRRRDSFMNARSSAAPMATAMSGCTGGLAFAVRSRRPGHTFKNQPRSRRAQVRRQRLRRAVRLVVDQNRQRQFFRRQQILLPPAPLHRSSPPANRKSRTVPAILFETASALCAARISSARFFPTWPTCRYATLPSKTADLASAMAAVSARNANLRRQPAGQRQNKSTQETSCHAAPKLRDPTPKVKPLARRRPWLLAN